MALSTGTKVAIGVGVAVVVGFGIYWFFIREGEKVASNIKGDTKKQISDEDSEKILLANEIVKKLASVTKFKDEASKKEMMKKEYDFWMSKTLKEVQEKNDRTK